MKVGMVGKFPEQQDGIAIYTASLCDELEGRGISIIRIGDSESTAAAHKVDFRSLLLKWKLQEVIEQEKLDILHIQYVASHFGKLTLNIGLLLALRQKIPVIVTLHEVHAEAETIRGKVLNWLQRCITRKAAAIVVHTQQQKELLHMRYRKRQVFCILHGLSLNPVHKLKDKKLLLFGMLNYGKGAEYLIRAMNELPDFRLTVAGKAITADYERIVKAAADDNRLGNVRLDIKWVPEDEKRRLLEAADIMVFPYVWAPYQSGTLHNAFSYGMPVVVTDAGAISEVVKEFRCGVVVEQRSPKALAAGIKKVYDSYDIYQHGVLKYREEANWQRSAQNHAEAYNLTLQEHYEAYGMPEPVRVEDEEQTV